jgi:hypothetical protein
MLIEPHFEASSPEEIGEWLSDGVLILAGVTDKDIPSLLAISHVI